MRHLNTIFAVLAFAAGCATVAPAQDLDARIKYDLRKVTASLEKAENYIGREALREAKVQLEAAEQVITQIRKDYQFDENHSDFAAIVQRLEKVAVTLRGAGKAKPETKPKTESSPGGKRLDARVSYVLKQVKASLDRGEDLLQKQRLDQLGTFVERIEAKLAGLFKDFPVDQNHPEIVAIRKRIDQMRAGLGNLGAKAETMKARLPSLLAALQAAEKRLQASLNALNPHELALARVDTAAAIKQGIDSHAEPIGAMQTTVESCNQILVVAQEATAAFRKQYPDHKELQILVKDSWRAIDCLERVEQFGPQWNRTREDMAQGKLRAAKRSVTSYSKRLEWAQQQEASVRRTTADGIEEHGIVEPAAWLRLVQALFAGEASLTDVQKKILATAKDLDNTIFELRKGVAVLREQIVSDEKLRLGTARFPSSSHQGSKWKQVETNMRKAFARFAPGKPLHRVSVYSPWDQRTEARYRGGRWTIGTYRYLGGHCLAKLPNGSYRCYRLTFRRTQQGGGAFGPLEVFGVGHSFQVLAENIDR